MSTLPFYRQQAEQQQAAADASSLENVRERCQRASDAWVALADRIARVDKARAEATYAKLIRGMSENPDRGLAAA